MENENHILWAIANGVFSGDQISASFRRNADPSKRNSVDREKRSCNGQFDSLQGVVVAVNWLANGVQIVVKKSQGGYGSLTTNQEIFSLSHKGQEIL